MDGINFPDFLIRRQPHFDYDLLKDVTPITGWVGQVPTGDWGPFSGTARIGHRIRRMFPDLSGCWKTVVETGCLDAPCDPERKKVGFGFDQFEYHLEETYFETDIFCFPLILSADAAKEQFAAVIEGLREATLWIWNQRFRTEAVKACQTKVLCGSLFVNANPEWNDDCTVMTTSGAPTSKITINFLQRFVDPLTLAGYFGKQYLLKGGMFVEFITDAITSNHLREQNPALQNYCQNLTPEEFYRLYQYGITGTIGNFMLHLDPTPLRYLQISATKYEMVQPYENQPAAAGIGADVNNAYIGAGIQWDLLWHRDVMKSLVRRTSPVNPQMPFMAIDFGGRWQFVQDNMVTRDDNGNLVPVGNEMRNKGKFIANFSAATKPQHTEWGVAILSLREQECVVDDEPCTDAYPYVEQDYSSANDPCPTGVMDIDIATAGPYLIAAGECNGVSFVATPVDGGDTQAQLVTYLNNNYAAYGTFSNPRDGVIRVSGTTCEDFDLTILVGTPA